MTIPILKISLGTALIICAAFAVAQASNPTALRSSHFRVVRPADVDTRDAEQLLNLLEANRTELLRRTSAAGIHVDLRKIEVFINQSTGDFTGRTGMPPWAAAATKNHRIELQPLPLLKRRRILETTLRHELVHVLVDELADGKTPRWLAEGMALYISGEGRLLKHAGNSASPETVEEQLSSAQSATEMRTAYAAAHNLVRELIRAEGESNVWKRFAERRYSVNVSATRHKNPRTS